MANKKENSLFFSWGPRSDCSIIPYDSGKPKFVLVYHFADSNIAQNPTSFHYTSLIDYQVVIKIRENLCAKWYTSTKICLEVVECVFKKFTEGPKLIYREIIYFF